MKFWKEIVWRRTDITQLISNLRSVLSSSVFASDDKISGQLEY